MKKHREDEVQYPMMRQNGEDIMRNERKTYMNKLNIFNVTTMSNKFVIDSLWQ